MDPKTIDQSSLFRYLLGELPEREQELLEEHYFQSTEDFDQVLFAEDDLIDLYVLGRLPSGQRERFESHFLTANPDRRRRLEFARLFRHYVRENTEVPEKVSWWQSLLAPLRMQQLAMASMALGLVVVGWLAFTVHQQQTGIREELAKAKEQNIQLQQQLERERAARRNEQIAQATPPPVPIPIPTFGLAPVLERSAGRVTQVRPGQAVAVRLRLALEVNEWTSYQATLETAEGRALWTRKNLQAAAMAVVAEIPSANLKPGDYVLRLRGTSATGADESVGDYAFQVPAQ